MKDKTSGVNLSPLSREQLEKTLEDEVFIDSDFKRQIKETAEKQNYSVELTETVVKHYIKALGLELIKVKRHKRRFLVFTYLYVEIMENKFNIFSKSFKNKSHVQSKFKSKPKSNEQSE